MRRSIVALLLLIAAASVGQETRPSTRAGRETLSRAEMEADLDHLLEGVRADWSYLEDKQKHFGVDLEALVARARSRLPDSATLEEFHETLTEIVAGLKDGHGSVRTPGVTRAFRRWPFTVADVAEGLVVVRVADAEGPLPRVGDVLVSVDGVPVEEAVARAERVTIASTDAARRVFAIEKLQWVEGDRVSVEVDRIAQDGTQARLAIDAPTLKRVPPGLALSQAEGPAWEVDRPAPGIARLCVREFSIDDWKAWLAAKPEEREGLLAKTKERIDACMSEVSGAEALVVDLRGNGGGTDLLGIHLAKHLVPERFIYFRLSAKHGGKWRRPHGYEHDPHPPERRFDGPLAFLVDEHCFSTTDNFLRAVLENRDDVIVVGRPTNGGTGAPRPIVTLPNSGAAITLCTQRVSGPKGTITEGRGTSPTHPVRWSARDYVEGRDPDLAAALGALGWADSRVSTR
jgi:C-terminal processing protease CtpA/Prc